MTAKRIIETKTVMVPLEQTEEKIQLTLSLAEADVLMVIFQNIGGDPRQSKRRFTNKMQEYLISAGVSVYNNEIESSIDRQLTSGIYFKDNDHV